MAQVTCLILLVLLITIALPSSTHGQNARGNGKGRGNLSPLEPGMPGFTQRNKTRCPRRIRTYDGTCTNSKLRAAGSASTAQYSYFRMLSSVIPNGNGLKSARQISNILSAQPKGVNIYNDRNVNEFLVFFGQFLDHTIIASTADSESMDIEIPPDDVIMSNFSSGVLQFHRSLRALVTSVSRRRKNRPNPERPINILSSAIDLSSVYGSDKARADHLRTFINGLLKTSANNLLPFNEFGFFNAPSSSNTLFLAGDHRVNEHPALLSFHTLFVREHNSIATELKQAFKNWNDNELYETARQINIAQFQKIVFEEFFPSITGRKFPIPYKNFNRKVDPSVSIEFSTAAFRVGHTMVGEEITLCEKDMVPMDPIQSNRMFFNPDPVKQLGIEPFLRGSMYRKAQEVDPLVSNTLRNFLFSSVTQESGFDLIALNIQRGRDAALPTYKRLRNKFGNGKPRSMSDITSDPTLQSKLFNAYGNVNKVEAWMGLMAEDHMPGSSMGPTMYNIWVEEFRRLRDGDRLFYQKKNLFRRKMFRSYPRLSEIYSESNTMAQILYRNTEVTSSEVGPSVWFSNRHGDDE